MEQLKWHQLTQDEVLEALQSSTEAGISAEQAKKRLEQHGLNELSEAEKISPIHLFLNQFKDFMVLVLLGATLISGFLGEYLDAITIILIIVINAVLGFVQEFKAEKSLQALKLLSAPSATVIRDAQKVEISANELVIGDIIYLESGDRVPADVRFLEANQLYIEESALTGESVPVGKHDQIIHESEIPLGDQRNLGFMGTLVTRGTAKAVIVRTGMSTEMGNIATLIQSTEAMQTPLQHRLEQLGKILIGVAILLTIVVVVAGILHGQPAYSMFLAGVTLAVAAIPEGLPAIVTVALALGVQRMIKRQAIVRKLPSVETLGCASVICSDKTGTLTQNKMTVTKVWVDNRMLDVSGDGYTPKGEITYLGQRFDHKQSPALRRLLQISALCNNASLELQEGETVPRVSSTKAEQWILKGDPTEGALIVLAEKLGFNSNYLRSTYKRVLEFPFESERKRMSVAVEQQTGQMIATKGAPDVLLDCCSHIIWEGKVQILTESIRSRIMAAYERMGKDALRVLGFAYKDVPSVHRSSQANEVEQKMVFAGLAGMIDPPRAEVKDAIVTCRAAGIKTVMITGDHRYTAEAIAHMIGIIPTGGKTLTGSELDKMSDEQLNDEVDNIYVYSRVSPEHKLKIVRALQNRGHVVAMTGDGVNDAPAIKAADIGVAMGITGTDVSKEASSLVLSDDNFSTIVAAIEEGRNIYENIRKFIRYLLASNVGEILVMFLAMLAGLPLPLVPIQILWVNLVTDGLPAMALGVDQAESNLMTDKPRKAKENIFARRLGWKIISRGVLIGVCTLAAFWLTLREGDLVRAQTVAFATLVMAQLIHVFDCRSSRSIFHRKFFENKWLVLSVLSSLILMLVVMYYPPLQPIFNTVSLGLREWALVFVMAAFPTVFFGIGSVYSGKKKRPQIKINSNSLSPVK